MRWTINDRSDRTVSALTREAEVARRRRPTTDQKEARSLPVFPEKPPSLPALRAGLAAPARSRSAKRVHRFSSTTHVRRKKPMPW